MSKRILSFVMSLFLLAGGATGVSAQQRQVTGTVTASDQAPVAGALVTIAGTRRGVQTDAGGRFSISVPSGDASLTITRIGFTSRTVSVPASQSSVNVRLSADVLNLEAVVVTGQATATRRENLANDVAVVTAENLTGRVPAQTVERALQGKVAGATIRTNSGAPGGGTQVRLRGPTTITGNSSPLYVVDGVIISDVSIPGGSNAVSRASSGVGVNNSNQDNVVNRAADLNPNDIESIEVLKGASAASIYGSRAAAGVVVITTKRGRAGAPRFNLSQRVGVAEISRKLGSRTLDRSEAIALGYVTAASADTYFNADGTPKATYDLEEQVFGRSAPQRETQLSISGGNEATQYYISGLTSNEQGIAANTGFERQAATLSLRQTLGSRIRLNASSQVLHSVAARGVTGNDNTGASYVSAISFTPNFFSLRPVNGVFPRNPFSDSNPLETSERATNDEDVWRVIGSLSGTFDILERGAHTLRLVGTGGVDYFNQDNRLYYPSNIQLQPFPTTPGTAVSGGGTNLNMNTSANLVHVFNPGSFRATTSFGAQYEDRDLRQSQVTGRYLLGSLELPFQASDIASEGSRQRSRDVGGYVQEELLLLDESLSLTGSLRGDRSSNNADSDKLYYYPKLAGAYTLPFENSWLSQFKVRSAYGASGNVPTYTQRFTPLSVRNITGTPAVIITGPIGDDELRPERVTEIEGGFDATLFNSRALLTFTGYRRNITELLLSRTLAGSTGFTTQFFNGGKMESNGVEASLQASLVQRGSFQWNSTTTFSRNRTKVTDLEGLPQFSAGNSFGTGFGSFLITEGYSPTTVFANDGPEGLVLPIGESEPDFQMGFLNEVRFGRFSLSGLLDWSKGGLVVNLTRNYFDAVGLSPDYELPAGVTSPRLWEECGLGCASGLERDYWHQRGRATYVEPAGFVKLREVSLAFDVPSRYLGNRVSNATIQLSGRNLRTWTDYSGYDPEVSNFGNVAAGRNQDVTPFPPSRTFWVGLNLGF